jgi:hypothetical protein
MMEKMAMFPMTAARPNVLSTIIASQAWLTASLCLAHPGHETLPVEPESAWHYLLEPQHILLPIGIGAFVALVAVIGMRRWWLRRTAER